MKENENYKYVDYEMDKKKRSLGSKISGVFSFIISAMCLMIGIVFLADVKSVGVFLFILIFVLIFAGAGVYFFRQPQIEEKRSRKRDGPDSKEYKIIQKELEENRDEYLKRAENHESLKKILWFRDALNNGRNVLIGLIILLPVIFFGYPGIIFYAIINLLLIINFIFSLCGRRYKIFVKGYALLGLEKDEAKSDFASSRVYFYLSEAISVSSRIIMASKQLIMINIEKIVWVYAGYDNYNQYNFFGKVYSHTNRRYCVVFSLSTGNQIKLYCPEELCSVLINDVLCSGIAVTAGYAPELQQLFDSDPENFRNAVKNGIETDMSPFGPVTVYDDNKFIIRRNPNIIK